MPMPKIGRKKQVASTSTHVSNNEAVGIEDNTEKLENHMSPETLIEPDETEGGSTYTSITASTEDAPQDDTTNISTIDEDQDPTDGYIEVAEVEDEDEIDPDFEVDANEEEVLENNDEPQVLEGSLDSDTEEDWDPAPVDDGMDDDIEETDMDDATDGDIAIDETVDEDEPEVGADAMDLLDVDEVPEEDTDGVMFATAGTSLMVIKAHRIIASMTRKTAVASGRNDIYLSDQFQEVAASEIKDKGLRKGLKSMGFTLAKVSFAKASVVKKQVAREVQVATAAVRKVNASKDHAMEQSMAIAAVGLNRRFFPDHQIELKSHLITELTQAGVRNAHRIISAAFGEYGPQYAKVLIELGKKISAMPQETRDSFVAAMDMTGADLDDSEEDFVQIGDEAGTDDDEFVESSVEATLATAGTHKPAAVTAGRYSAELTDVFAGKAPLFSL